MSQSLVSQASLDGSRPISSIQQVWDFLTLQLRDLRAKLRAMHEEVYGKQDRLAYVGTVHQAIKQVLDSVSNKSLTTIGCFKDLEELLASNIKTARSPRQIQSSIDAIKKYHTQSRIVVVKAIEVKTHFTEDVLHHLERYCNNYSTLGIADDKFYKTLQARTVTVREHLKKFDKLVARLRLNTAISQSTYCDCYFSQEISIEYNCDTFPIIRIIPDLVQKLEMSCDIAADWLRSDKVYLEEADREIEKTRAKVKESEQQLQLCKLEYDRIFALLKQKQMAADEYDETHDAAWKELSKMESKKARLEMEITAVGKTLAGCRDQLQDLCDCQASESEDEVLPHTRRPINTGTGRLGNASSNYRSRLCHDARAHSQKIDMLRRKKKKLEKSILKKRQKLKEMEGNEAEVQQLSKKLRICGRQKARLMEELDAATSHLKALTTVIKDRMSIQKSTPTAKAEKKKATKPKKRVVSVKKGPRKRSADLLKAFRIVKNNIGLGWKDLARTLPYAPDKAIAELNNEIKVIEYENQGQLKEQAYQSLVKWYSHNGRRASVEILHSTLRELHENRLADNIRHHVLQEDFSSSEYSRPTTGSATS